MKGTRKCQMANRNEKALNAFERTFLRGVFGAVRRRWNHRLYEL